MQGVFVDGRRPKSKKAVKEAVADNPERVSLEATSLHGGEFDGRVSELPVGGRVQYFVGPDPYTARNFYGQVFKNAAGKVVVK